MFGGDAMIQTYLIGGLLALIAIGGIYISGDHHGYNRRVGEENQTVVKAQPKIKKGGQEYEENVKAINSTAEGSCGVDPVISIILDRLH